MNRNSCVIIINDFKAVFLTEIPHGSEQELPYNLYSGLLPRLTPIYSFDQERQFLNDMVSVGREVYTLGISAAYHHVYPASV